MTEVSAVVDRIARATASFPTDVASALELLRPGDRLPNDLIATLTSPRSIALPEYPTPEMLDAMIEGIWGTYRPGEAEMGIRKEAALRGYQAMMRAVNGRSE